MSVFLTSTPSIVSPAGSVVSKIKLSNPSQCPVGEVVAIVLPFITQADLDTGDPLFSGILQALVGAACSGQPVEVPGGITCQLGNGSVTCECDTCAQGPDVLGEVSLPLGRTGIECRRSGNRIICPLPTSAVASDALCLPPASLMCSPIGEAAFCGADNLAGGEMVMADLPFNAPLVPGTYFNIAFAGALQLGVCKTGSDQGEPCDGDGDCTGGGLGSCGSGICVNDMTQQASGVGCDTSGDCSGLESCVACRDTSSALPLGVACSSTIVTGSVAPTMSASGKAAVILLLMTIGVLGIRAQLATRSPLSRR